MVRTDRSIYITKHSKTRIEKNETRKLRADEAVIE